MTDQLESRLERTLEAQAALLPDLDEAAVPARPLSKPRSRTARVSGPVAAVIAAAAVLLILGGSVFLLGRDSTRRDPAAPDGSQPPSDLSVQWTKSDFAPDDWHLELAAASDDGMVLIGRSTTAAHDSQGWFSDSSGDDWFEFDAFDGGTVIRGLAAGSYGYLASGIRLDGTGVTVTTMGEGPPPTGPPPVIWYSPDGTTWTETALPLPREEDRLSESTDYYVRPVAGTDRVLVVAGSETDESGAGEVTEDGQIIPSRPVVWWSDDGSTWRLVDEPAWDDATSAGSIATSGDLIALVISNGGQVNRSAVWTTEDGENWAVTYEFEAGVYCDVVGAPEGFVAACSDGTVRFAADAVTWTISLTNSEDRHVGHLAGGDGGYVMALVEAEFDPEETDLSGLQPLCFASVDGQTWEPISDADTFGDGFLPGYIANPDGGVIVLGNRHGEGSLLDQIGAEQPEMWIGVPQG